MGERWLESEIDWHSREKGNDSMHSEFIRRRKLADSIWTYIQVPVLADARRFKEKWR